MNVCEHGNTYACLPCEVVLLKHVIEELIEQNDQLKHRIPREVEEELRRKVERLEQENRKLSQAFNLSYVKNQKYERFKELLQGILADE